MKASKSLIFLVIILCAAPQAVMPACGWYWPILGFSDGFCPNVIPGPALPPPHDRMLPGTFQWGYPPVGRAELVTPGCAYGTDAFHGVINLGSTPPFGLAKMSYGVPEGNETAVSRTNNTSAEGTNATIEGKDEDSGDLRGWLSSR